MKIIALGHYSRTGKDTVANELCRLLNFEGMVAKKIPFAWKLKQITHQLYGWAGMQGPDYYDTDEGALARNEPLSLMASEKYPKGPTPVQIWIDFGTPAVRENVYQASWINYLLKTDHDCDVLVIPDARFLNEVTAIKETGGTLIKVVRPGYRPRIDSPADMNLFTWRGWDGIIGTSGSMDELIYEADRIARYVYDGDPIPFNQMKINKGYRMEEESGVPQSAIDKYSVQENEVLKLINRRY